MNLVQQLRDLLDLVEDHRRAQPPGRARQEALAEKGRALGELQHEVGLEQVEGQAAGKRRSKEGAFPVLRGPQRNADWRAGKSNRKARSILTIRGCHPFEYDQTGVYSASNPGHKWGRAVSNRVTDRPLSQAPIALISMSAPWWSGRVGTTARAGLWGPITSAYAALTRPQREMSAT